MSADQSNEEPVTEKPANEKPVAEAAHGAGTHSGGLRSALVTRQLMHYPERGPRYFYLGLSVLTTIVLYYLYYVEGAVTPTMLPYYHMSFQYFLYLLVVSNAIGSATAFIGGLSDKIGRANLAIYGTLVVGLIQLVGIPNIHTKLGFAIAYCGIGFVEGIILVVTPALIRDFSPQLGRGAAMGFWALGPVLGSLVASSVATNTLPAHTVPIDFRGQFIISGWVCMGIVVLAFLGLRELAAPLRDQLMVSEKERALVEARAKGIDVEAAVAHPLRSMMKPDILSSAFAVSVFLLIYYASVSVLTLYWVVVFNRTSAQANGINQWYWVGDAVTLVTIGVISDRLRVRKPFMLIGGLGTIVVTVFFILQAGHPETTYAGNVVIVLLLGIAIGFAYTPWMAGYTEAVEARNPALSATGLAIWGWLLRFVVAISFLVLPRVITTATTLVDNQAAGGELQAMKAAQPYAPPTTPGAPIPPNAPPTALAQLDATGQPGPETLASIIRAYDNNGHNLFTALTGLDIHQVQALIKFQPLATEIQEGKTVSDAQIAAVAALSPDLGNLLRAERLLVPAQNKSPNQWKQWWWVCLGGQVVFVGLVFAMRGPWSPRSAKAELEERERLVERELAELAKRGQAISA